MNIIRIITTSLKGSLQDRCRDILSHVPEGQPVLGITFFFEADNLNEYLSGEAAISEACSERFGMAVPMLCCVAEKPVGSTLAAEVLFPRGDGWIEYHDDYLVLRGDGPDRLITKGIHFPEAGDTGAQAKLVFSRLRDILDTEGFEISEIVRQWNYIEGITETSDGKQNYQMFNDARSAFYEGADWSGGYPAATGIGCSAGGVTVCLQAVKGSRGISRPIDNPIQIPAHKYSEKVLKDGKETVRTTPKFERARLLDDTVLVSGTAAIKGEDSEFSTDPAAQALSAIDVIGHLVDPGNIFPGCRRFRFEAIRVYIKREEDVPAITEVLGKHWKGVPMHFLMADICRPELLLELEGVGSVGRFLEGCCTDAAEAFEAQAGGAERIELCEDLPCGGVTPAKANLEEVLRSVAIPVNVLVRPRGGNFVYNEEEVLEMISSIGMCREAGVNGVVIGALKEDGSIDTGTMKRLIAAAEGLHVTFHRAFDECRDPLEALEEIIALGCDRLLTAGHAANVGDGARMLKVLNEKASGRIVIMAGSGVRPGNIAGIEELAGLTEFHSSSHGPDGRTSRETVALMCRSKA